MRRNKLPQPRALGLTLIMLLPGVACHCAFGYADYSGCKTCHGDFLGSTSPKGTVFPSSQNHEMHRASTSMATACNLCHTGASRVPVYTGSSNGTANNAGLGCSGCHVGSGLRAHHVINGVIECLDCHPAEVPPAENVKPPYYGTADTKVNNPGNPVRVANTNENWSIGDFLGLDNDGNNLYDLADYAVGPTPLLTAAREGNHVRVTWQTAGGRTETLQAAGKPDGPFTNVSPALQISGVGLVTTNYLEVGGATNGSRFYRLSGALP